MTGPTESYPPYAGPQAASTRRSSCLSFPCELRWRVRTQQDRASPQATDLETIIGLSPTRLPTPFCVKPSRRRVTSSATSSPSLGRARWLTHQFRHLLGKRRIDFGKLAGQLVALNLGRKPTI